MSKFSINFLSGTASSTPLVSPPWPGALDGALQGTLMQERPGHSNNNPWSWVRLWQETAACWQRPLPSPAPGLSHLCSPVQKRGFFFYSFLWDLHHSAMSPTNPGQGRFNMYANTWNPPNRGLHTDVFHCTTLHVRTHTAEPHGTEISLLSLP